MSQKTLDAIKDRESAKAKDAKPRRTSRKPKTEPKSE